jgi:hypothetical protein
MYWVVGDCYNKQTLCIVDSVCVGSSGHIWLSLIVMKLASTSLLVVEALAKCLCFKLE